MNKAKKSDFHMGIKGKMIYAFTLISIVIVFASDVAIFNLYSSDVIKTESAYIADGNSILSDNIANVVSTIEEKLVSETDYCTVFSYMDSLDEIYKADVERNLKSLATLMKMRGTDVESIYIFDKYHCSYFYSENQDEDIATFRGKEVYDQIKKNYDSEFSKLGSSKWRSYEDNPEEIYLIKNYIDPDSTDYKGVICVTFTRNYFETLLGKHDFASVIYDENNNLLYCSDELRDKEIGKSDSRDDQYMTARTAVRGKGWTLEALVNRNTVIERVQKLIATLLLCELPIFAGMLVVIVMISRGMLRNILTLSENFKDIRSGKKAAHITPHSHDETSYLCEQFNLMNSELQHSVEQMAQENTLREKAEYNALLAQMNPHFLYNSLESIGSMAKLAGEDDIVKTINMLGYLLRVSFSGISQEITLKEELQYIRYYLELQKTVTANTKLEWDISVDNEAEECFVPKLILQPIVENSICHGFRDIADEGIIVITCKRDGDSLALEVCDNGKGARQEDIDCIMSMHDYEDGLGDRAHIGIRSIQKRIKILYGDNYGIRFVSTPGEGMIVRIILPWKKG